MEFPAWGQIKGKPFFGLFPHISEKGLAQGMGEQREGYLQENQFQCLAQTFAASLQTAFQHSKLEFKHGFTIAK